MTTTSAADPLRVQLEQDRDRAIAAARGVAARGVKSFEDSASLEQHLDLAERSTARLANLHVNEPLVYAPDAPTSYFRDQYQAQLKNDSAAIGRLERHAEQMSVEMPRLERKREAELAARGGKFSVSIEKRALGNSGATGGSGGEWAPPLWLTEQAASVPRAAAPLAAACTQLPMTKGWSTVSVPLFTVNPGTGVQSSQNTTVQDFGSSTTGFTSSGIATYAGKAVVSQQLVDTSPAGAGHLDQIVFTDLIGSAWEQLEAAVINGTGTGGQLRGLLNTAGITASTFTNASPSGTTYLTALAQTASLTSTARRRLVTMALVHPRRWFWLASQVDSSNRPLVEPGEGEFSPAGDAGPFGPLFGMLPVYATTAMPTTVNTNQDPTLVTRPSDHLLFTSVPSPLVAHETFADTVGVLFRLHLNAAFIGGRYPTATGVLTGTGVAAPAGY